MSYHSDYRYYKYIKINPRDLVFDRMDLEDKIINLEEEIKELKKEYNNKIINIKKELYQYKYKDFYDIKLIHLFDEEILKDYIYCYLNENIYYNNYFKIEDINDNYKMTNKDYLYDLIYNNIVNKNLFECLEYDDNKINSFLKKFGIDIKMKKTNINMFNYLTVFKSDKIDVIYELLDKKNIINNKLKYDIRKDIYNYIFDKYFNKIDDTDKIKKNI